MMLQFGLGNLYFDCLLLFLLFFFFSLRNSLKYLQYNLNSLFNPLQWTLCLFDPSRDLDTRERKRDPTGQNLAAGKKKKKNYYGSKTQPALQSGSGREESSRHRSLCRESGGQIHIPQDIW